MRLDQDPDGSQVDFSDSNSKRPSRMKASQSIELRVAMGARWALGGKILNALSVVGINVLLAHVLLPDMFGRFFLAASFVAGAAILAQLGLAQTATRLLASSLGAGRLLQARMAIRFVFLWGIAGTIGVGIPFALVLVWFGYELALALILALWMAGLAWQTLAAEALRGFHDIRGATIIGGVLANLIFAALLLAWWLGKGTTTLDVAVMFRVASEAASILLAMLWLRRMVDSSMPANHSATVIEGKPVLALALPVMINNLVLFSLTQVDIWILGAFRSSAELAVYGAAAKLIVLISLPLGILNSAIAPMIAELYAKAQRAELERMLQSVAALASILGGLIMIPLLFGGGPILRFLYGNVYENGAAVMVFLGLGQIVSVLTGPCALTLLMTGRQKSLMGVSIFTGVLTVLLAFIFVSAFGIVGVAAAIGLGVIGQNIAMWLIAKHSLGIWTHPQFSKARLLAFLGSRNSS